MIDQLPASPQGGGGLLRVRLDVAYDGAPFSGWARQPGLPTVQAVLENGIETVLRRPVRLTVAGRTDAGVHARGQVAHLDLTREEWQGLSRGRDIAPETALLRRLRATVDRELPVRASETAGSAVVVRAVSLAPPGFDARFSALWRRYSYRIADDVRIQDPLGRGTTLWYSKPLDADRMNDGAALLLGLQDFRAFCKPRPGATTVRELQRFEFERGSDDVIAVVIQADAFCHNMVRALIGSTLRVGTGEMTPSWLHERLLARSKDAMSLLAPPHPLVLEQVKYPDDDVGLRRRAEATRARRVVA